jgi:hypothetical protein
MRSRKEYNWGRERKLTKSGNLDNKDKDIDTKRIETREEKASKEGGMVGREVGEISVNRLTQ